MQGLGKLTGSQNLVCYTSRWGSYTAAQQTLWNDIWRVCFAWFCRDRYERLSLVIDVRVSLKTVFLQFSFEMDAV